jgi:hypothetical protein
MENFNKDFRKIATKELGVRPVAFLAFVSNEKAENVRFKWAGVNLVK